MGLDLDMSSLAERERGENSDKQKMHGWKS